MTTDNNANNPENVVAEYYDNYAETQKEVIAIETRKTRNKLFVLAAVIFITDLLALLATDMVAPVTIMVIAVVPVAVVGLAFLAYKEPLTAMIIATVIIVSLWVYAIIVTGGQAAVMGWLAKAVIAYLIFAGFQHAREVIRIRKELKA